jgi:hypothetical protein
MGYPCLFVAFVRSSGHIQAVVNVIFVKEYWLVLYIVTIFLRIGVINGLWAAIRRLAGSGVRFVPGAM